MEYEYASYERLHGIVKDCEENMADSILRCDEKQFYYDLGELVNYSFLIKSNLSKLKNELSYPLLRTDEYSLEDTMLRQMVDKYSKLKSRVERLIILYEVEFLEKCVLFPGEKPVTAGPSGAGGPSGGRQAPEPSAPPVTAAPPAQPATTSQMPTGEDPADWIDIPPEPAVPEDSTGEYLKCVEKCRLILEKIGPLKNRLKRLKAAAPENVQAWEKELARLKNIYRISLKRSTQQKFIALNGKEHWGAAEFRGQYIANGYKPVDEPTRIDPGREQYLKMLNGKIAALENKIFRYYVEHPTRQDENARQNEMRKIEEEMAKVREEHRNCVKSCERSAAPPKQPPKKPPKQPKIPPIIKGYFRPTPRPAHPHQTPSSPQTTPTPQPTPPVQPPPQPQTSDTSAGSQGMPIEEPKPLEATEGFDAEPALDTRNYATTVVPLGTEEVQYVDIKGDRAKCDIATLYKPTPQGMDVTASTVATGQGADFRKWKVDDVRMNLDGEVIKPDKEEDFYIEKNSYYREAAAVTLAAIGSQYRRCAGEAQSGEVCPVTGQKKEVSERKDTIADGIDSAGMAAGMGLLASQARGSIPAKKVTFNLDKTQAKKLLDKKGELRVTAKNETAHQDQTFKVPMR